MKIISKKISEIIPYENNPRNNENAAIQVAEAIKKFGFLVPIIIDKNNVIIAGHTRLKSAKMLGLEEIPCVVAKDLNEAQVKAFRLIDNKVSEVATWDEEKLKLELEEIELLLSEDDVNLDFEMCEFGFEDMRIDEDGKSILVKKL